jgi:hypothetical protein
VMNEGEVGAAPYLLDSLWYLPHLDQPYSARTPSRSWPHDPEFTARNVVRWRSKY